MAHMTAEQKCWFILGSEKQILTCAYILRGETSPLPAVLVGLGGRRSERGGRSPSAGAPRPPCRRLQLQPPF